VQANYGSSRLTLPGVGGTIEAKQAWGITYAVEYHAAPVHLAYQRHQLTLDSVNRFSTPSDSLGRKGSRSQTNTMSTTSPYPSLQQATYDPGKWFVTDEWNRTENRSFLGKGTGWYVSGGYRFGKFTPYLTYAQAKADNLSDPGLNLAALPPSLVG